MNPFAILDIDYDASCEEIQRAFHKKLASGESRETLTAAYALIKDPAARKRYRWSSIESLIAIPFNGKQPEQSPSFEKIIKEVAFQTPWELGDDEWILK